MHQTRLFGKSENCCAAIRMKSEAYKKKVRENSAAAVEKDIYLEKERDDRRRRRELQEKEKLRNESQSKTFYM